MHNSDVLAFLILGAVVLAMALGTVFLAGYYWCQGKIIRDCLAHGSFKAQGVAFSCSRYIEYEGDKGVPEAILEHEQRQNEKYRDSVDQAHAIAPSTLDKLKWLDPKTKDDLLGIGKKHEAIGEEVYRLNIMGGELKGHDCLQCFKDAGDRPRIMILCSTCGNKRCPKAEDHRYKCTGSNDPDQVGQFEDVADCVAHAVFNTPLTQYSHLEQPKKRKTTADNSFYKP
ncbi:hypothetical protein CDG62_00160 (plasmid) [Acinetobacter sp. WCHA55]|uniref:hypothetical protein n=1 Tax=Acinetobacter sp. WCHA55 TaxID=2004646 RepID=UPI000B3C4AB7|nr:hypothetical protein [Acinetobacter sp. WCHA55]AYA66880.1 hypothetical protein CDG62_00160 [Acinetobacter sp. WCHA55]